MLRMTSIRWCLAVLTAVVVATPASSHAQAVSAIQSRARTFDRLDRTSRSLIAKLSCARGTAQSRSRGLFGPLDSLGGRGMCIVRNGRVLGLFLGTDSAMSRALTLRVVDLANAVRDTAPVDTGAILAEARAASHATLRGHPQFEREQRQYAPFSIRSDGDSIEVWLLPATLLLGQVPTSLGGERGFIFSPDARTLVREIDAFDRFRTITPPLTGPVDLQSLETDLPLLSELLAMTRLHERGRIVSLSTKTYTSSLVGAEPNAMWVHSARD